MPKKAILLVHGLAESAAAMGVLASAFRMQGHEVILLDYPSTKFSMEECTDKFLAPAIEKLSDKRSLSIVTHSMGGILVRYYLEHNNVKNLERVVMLVPGHGGSRTMRAMRHHPLFPIIMGPAGIQSSDDENLFDPGLGTFKGAELGIIAGCLSFDLIGSTVMPWPHDGKIMVNATKIDGMKDHIVLPVSHDSVLFDPLAIYLTGQFIEHGTFNKNQNYSLSKAA